MQQWTIENVHLCWNVTHLPAVLMKAVEADGEGCPVGSTKMQRIELVSAGSLHNLNKTVKYQVEYIHVQQSRSINQTHCLLMAAGSWTLCLS